jgi:hypothetical protein
MNNRRDFLKTSALGISGLFAMSHMSLLAKAQKGSTSGTPRFIFLRKSSGISPQWVVPPSIKDKETAMEVSLDKHQLPSWMEPLNKHKKNLTLLNGLSAKMCTMGHGTGQAPLVVSKVQPGRADSIPRASVDVVLGRLFPTPFGHMEFISKDGMVGVIDGLSSFGPRTPNIAFASPRAGFETIFAHASNDKNVQMKNELEGNMYKFLHGNLAGMSKKIKDKDNFRKYDAYTQSVDSVIKRNDQLFTMKDQIKKYAPKLSSEIMADKYNTVEQHNAFADLALASMYAGLTNSVTITLDVLSTPVSGVIGETIGLHHIGHNKPYGSLSAIQVREKLRTHHMSVVDRLVTGLKKMPEGNGTMFDNTVIMYLPENGEAHHSRGTAVPFVILSGDKVKMNIGGGRYIRLPEYSNSGHSTLGNFYTTILNAHGNPIKHYGDKDVGIKFNQEGAIKQLMNG